MADRGEEAGLGLVRRLGGALGLDQCLIQLRQLLGAFADALFQAFVGVLQGPFGLAVRGDVTETHDEAAAGHRVADQLDDPAVGEQPLGGVGAALAHPVQALGHMGIGVARAAQAALGVVADNVGDRPADVDQPVRILEEFEIAMVPGHQAQRLVDHADALGDVFDRALQQRSVELQHLGGLADDTHDVVDLHVAAFQRGLDHRTGGGRAEHAGEQALGMRDPLAVGLQFGREVLAMAASEALEALLGALGADEARCQGQQVLDAHGEQAPRAGGGGDFLADEAAGLPVLCYVGLSQDRDPEEQRGVADQRQGDPEGQAA